MEVHRIVKLEQNQKRIAIVGIFCLAGLFLGTIINRYKIDTYTCSCDNIVRPTDTIYDHNLDNSTNFNNDSSHNDNHTKTFHDHIRVRRVKRAVKAPRKPPSLKQKAIAHFVVQKSIEGHKYTSDIFKSADGVPYRIWELHDLSDGTNPSNITGVFRFHKSEGSLVVLRKGYYLIYSKITYHDLAGRWSYAIYIGDKAVDKCVLSEQLGDRTFDAESHGVYHTCSLSRVIYVKQYQSISIRCMYGSRRIMVKPDFTYWGIVQL